jgi:hypothetical protein
MARIHVFLQIPYRQMEGFVRNLATFIPGIKVADYTTLFRRIKSLCNWRCKSAHFRRAKSAHLLTFTHALEGSGNAEDGGLSHDT